MDVSITGMIKLIGSDNATFRNKILLARVCGILKRDSNVRVTWRTLSVFYHHFSSSNSNVLGYITNMLVNLGYRHLLSGSNRIM